MHKSYEICIFADEFIVKQNWFAKIRHVVETSHCGISPDRKDTICFCM